MRIKQIEIKNYKSLEKLKVEVFNTLNVFIGKNDAGKSNVFSALDLLFNSTISTYTPVNTIKENILETVFQTELSSQLYDKTNPVAEFTVNLSLSKKKRRQWSLDATNDLATLVFSKKLVIDKNKTKIFVDFIRLDKAIIVKTADEKNRFRTLDGKYVSKIEGTVAETILECLQNEFILIPANRIIYRDTQVHSRKSEAGRYIERSLIELANHKEDDKRNLYSQFKEFIKHLSPIVDTIEEKKKDGKIYDLMFKTSSGEEMPLVSIGGGNNELLLLLHEIILGGGKILAIEEPEIHLHPEAERKLYRFMKQFSPATQIFITTHETVFVQPDNINALFRVVRKGAKTRVHTMTSKQYVDKNRLRQELNAENCEIFFADKVLLVEGISDKIMMDGLIDRYCESTNEIKVISSFSKDNFEVYIDLLRIFKIPYLILTDLDAVKGQRVIKPIWREIKGVAGLKNKYDRIAYLKKKGIYVLSKGALEQSYPRKYHRGISKPLDALYAIYELKDEEYYSETMKDLREVIIALEK